MADAEHLKVARLMACSSCDQLYDLTPMTSGQRAHCARCGQFLSRRRADSFEQGLAWSLASLIFLVLACCFPFLSFKASSLESMMSLPQMVLALVGQGMAGLALLIACFIVFLPGTLLFLLAALCQAIRSGKNYRWISQTARWVYQLQHWCMAEVFFVGVLISLVKITGMATVEFGASFWFYAAFSICFIKALSSLDRLQTWSEIEVLAS